ncbi:ATP-binding protein [Myxococcus qinghaiensis]|uniref:ATP-binding protein n=1 Tax=Myxococcus qinghaiensis TaxID=2906758 RepID=UPI0020A82B17|nr:ATP-binding protein [Myxococcus qinghaiensis]MCP3164683.1 ATP-binding protein [Myxococcus qinghaiensis]
MELILFIGLQASGKSRFFQRHFADTHVLVSKDLWPHARRKEARQRRLIVEALGAGRSVVVDNTHPTLAQRAPLIALGHEQGAHVLGFYFESRLADCLARNAKREGRARVPEVALFATVKQLRRPSLEEGFDSLYHVSWTVDGGFIVEDWKEERDVGPG